MHSVKSILGRSVRQTSSSNLNNHLPSRRENTQASNSMLTTYFANAKVFSNRSEKDNMQVVGKLYKGNGKR